MMRRLLSIFTSGRTLGALVIGWAIFYVTWAVWGTEAFASYIGLLSEFKAVQAIYILFVLCVIGVTARQGIARFRESRLRFALWVVLPAGVIIFLIGFLLSASLRHSDKLAVAEGTAVSPPWHDAGFTVERLDAGLGEHATDTGSGIFQYAPKITAQKDDGSTKTIEAFPPTRIGTTYYHILFVDMAPSLLLRNAAGETLQDGLVSLRLLPPGATDDFKLQGLPYVFSLRVLPNEVKERGDEKIKTYHMKHPLYGLKIVKGDTTVFDGNSGAGPISFDGYTLSFQEPSYWVQLEAARDPGLPLLQLGIITIFTGLITAIILVAIRLWRALRPEREQQ